MTASERVLTTVRPALVCALMMGLACSIGSVAGAGLAHAATRPVVRRTAAVLTTDALIRAKIRHVFILYQENRSFDSMFGTFGGANGVWSPSARSHGFSQIDPVTHAAVTPFRYADPDTDDAGHARPVMIAKMAGGRMDRFVAVEAQQNADEGATSAQASAMGELTMGHIDCDTVPYLWYYASRFTLFDNFFQAMAAPSTPSNLEIIAAQTGLTQAARYPDQVENLHTASGQPMTADYPPQYGPYNLGRAYHRLAFDQTYANVLLELQGLAAARVVNDTHDVREDIRAIAARNRPPVEWMWYQEGFHDPADPRRLSYVTHHNAPQYFGYVDENDVMVRHLADLTAFFADVRDRKLADRGVYFVKGGYANIAGLRPAGRSAWVQKHFLGDDDHPGYSDSQISEALVARAVNAIARSPYWKDSAVVIAWDDSEGFWDHVPPPRWERCPDGQPCGDGPRVAAIVISPYARDHAVVHDLSDQTSVVKLVETVFDLPRLAYLPDEKPYLPQGPRDWNGRLSDLAGAFDGARLLGQRPLLPAARAMVPDAVVNAIPSPWNCRSIGVLPVPPPAGQSDGPPADFVTRPYEPRATAARPNLHGPRARRVDRTAASDDGD